MTKPFDPKAAIKAAKGHEKILAYSGFNIHMEATGNEPYASEGFVKIASNLKSPGDGFLRFTFLVDTESQTQKTGLMALFEDLNDEYLLPFLKDNLVKVTKVSLDELGEIRDWFIEEVNIHVRNLRDYEKTIVEKDLFPAFESLWPFAFQPVEWWPREEADEMARSLSDRMDLNDKSPLKRIFQKLFGS